MFFGFSALYSFIIIIGIFVVSYWLLPKKLSWLSFLITTYLLAVLAFRFEPNIDDDLSRYFSTIDYLRNGGKAALDHAIEMHWNSWHIYRVCGWYFYGISKLSNNHYLPAITIFIVYGLMFMIIHRLSKHYNASKFDTFLGSMFFISTYWYYDLASGIRNGLAFAVVFTCAYFHLLERRGIPFCIVGYVLACLTHSAAIMPVVLVIVTAVTLNNSGKFMNFLLVFGIIGGGAGIQFLSNAFPNSDFMQSIAGRAERNVIEDTLYTDTLYLTNIATVAVCAVIFFYFSYYIINRFLTADFKFYYKYLSILMYFVVGSVYTSLIFMRFARWIVPIIGAIIIIVGRTAQEDEISDKGEAFLKYYAPINARARFFLKPVVLAVTVAYIGVHFWYLCAGSSLNWIHF